MSNNNPHGHITQPTQNPSWNHLQIPSYIPRQPQLAHMSNERSMVRSPSAWHTPAPPPDSLYNFMSANHKNLEHQMNSLLPRSLLPPFDSMDLSLQSSRSSSSPLNKGHGPGMLPHEYGGHKHSAALQPPGPPPHQHQQHTHQQQQQAHQHQHQQQQQQQSHGPNSYPIHNLSSNSPSSLAQQQHQQSQHALHSQLSALQQSSPAAHGMQNATPQSPASPTANQGPSKYMNTNGNDCEGMLPPAGGGGGGSNSGGSTGIGGSNNNGSGSNGGSNAAGNNGGGPSPVHPYMRDSNDTPTHMGDSYGKVTHLPCNYEAELQSKGGRGGGGTKPVELGGKDCGYLSLISNKMPSHAQQQHQQQTQVSPKKHSPMRNYHTQQQHQHLQQHQQQQAFNNPQTSMKHNGPHTPPTPQSPVMHQQTGGPLHGMDYNQMQPPTQGAYPPHQQHPQQQQHMSQHLAPPPPQHALHYPPHPHAHSHSLLPQPASQQQQQQAAQMSQKNQQHHVTPPQQHLHQTMQQTQHQQQHSLHISPRMHLQHQQHQHQQQQQPLPTHQQQKNSSPPMHQQSMNATTTTTTHQHHSNSSNLTHLNDMTPAASNSSSSSAYNIHSADMKKKSPHTDGTVIAGLSPTAASTASNNPYEPNRGGAPSVACIPDSAESPSPEAISSHCESIDSNSNSSGGGGTGGGGGIGAGVSFRQRLPKRIGETKSTSITEHAAVDFESSLIRSRERGGDGLQQNQPQLPNNNIPRSPKCSPTEQTRRISPRTSDAKPPASNSNKSPPIAMANLGSGYAQHEKVAIASTPSSPISQTMENGRVPLTDPSANASSMNTDTYVDSEVETIDKISAMIASTATDSLAQRVDANSNSSIKSVGERESSIMSSGSPKTKKQRQALKLRNAAEYNSNSNGSSNSFSGAGNAPSRCMAMSDNALAVDELHKDLMQSELEQAETANDSKSSAPIPRSDRKNDAAGTINEAEIETEMDIRQPPPPLRSPCNSHSSSSSTSSSSCSNSSHSSNGTKTTTTPMTDKVVRSQRNVIASAVIVIEDDMKDIQCELSDTKLLEELSNSRAMNLNSQKDVVTATFEEVENKLEEMFAGIEDEPIVQEPENIASPVPVNTTEVVRDLSLALELSTNTSTPQSATPPTVTPDSNKFLVASVNDSSGSLHVRTDGPPPTKAAKKSTLPSPVRNPSTPENIQTPASPAFAETHNNVKEQGKENTKVPTPTPTVAPGRRSGPPRRRLSVAMDTSNLRFLLDDDDDDPDYMADIRPQRTKRGAAARRNNNNSTPTHSESHISKDSMTCLDDDDQPSTSAAAAAALAAKAAATLRTAKEQKSQAAGGGGSGSNNTKATPKNAKTRKKPETRKSANRAANTTKSGGRKKATGKQQQQRRKHQQNSSDDEAPLAQSTAAANTEQSKLKSPFILVKKDGSISVVNAPLSAEDVNEKHAAARQVKKPLGAAGYAHDRRNLRGLHSSTLSNKYDADTTDSTWICVFCKRGPHRLGLGDLFGPYLVSIDCEEYKSAVKAPDALDLDMAFESKRRRLDMIKTHPRNLPVMPSKANAATILETTLNAGRTAGGMKKPHDANSVLDTVNANATASDNDPLDCTADEELLQNNFIGMTKVSEKSYEVWLHEDCIVWAPDVFLVGVRVMGLDAAVWNSTRYHCTLCSKPGAIVCCLQRDCKLAAHVPCARTAGWSLNESIMQVHCQQHIPAKEGESEAKTILGTAASTTTTTAAISQHRLSVEKSNAQHQPGLKNS
ncbi:uncharacterized protein CG5098 isoform X2 [Eurosta solidaginis]|uniref:uncharacterized protein CG5098 isoform X2 n=1 Tax=Eurosta solidaginis TaxID=178769 RepID=UPI003530CFD7